MASNVGKQEEKRGPTKPKNPKWTIQASMRTWDKSINIP
jgi:hypothetical protein